MSGAIITMAIAALHAELAYRFGRHGFEADSRSAARWAMVLSACGFASMLDRFVWSRLLS